MKEQQNDQELYQLEDEMKDMFSSYVVKTPSSQDTKALIAALQPAFSQISEDEELEINYESLKHPSLISQFKSQISFYQWHFWIASSIIFIMLTLYTSNVHVSNAPIFYLFAIPLSMLVGIFYTYQSWNKQMRTIEGITPFPPALLILSRMIIIFAMNIIFGVVSSVYLSFTMDQFYLLPFLLHWIAPALFIFGLFAFCMMNKGVKIGLSMGIVTWIAIIIAEALYMDISHHFTISYIHIAGIQGAFFILGALLLYQAFRKSFVLQSIHQ
ncbi:hypothetical protein [Sutcliffiella halmapala]|uniref:hypothetical protein n=1 Tax=Sutcliffiella halmapala TaxID=79882 RepID=UPI0009957AD2|nr:hypothetical protein [Sutcliffiella halmapala]